MTGDAAYESRVRIERIRGTHRKATIPAHDGPVDFGVHGAIAAHYGVDRETEFTTTLDYVVAATGG